MDSKRYLMALMRGQTPQTGKTKGFFVEDGKVHPYSIKESEFASNLNVVVVTSKEDLQAWQAFKESGAVEACNNISKEDLQAWERYKEKVVNVPDPK